MTELVQQPEEPTPWRVGGLVADGTVTLLSAEAGMGKSILLQALCDGVTTGRTTAGFLCTKGVALYIDGEMGSKMFAGRLRKTGAEKCAFWYVDALGLDISIEKPDDLGWISGHVEQTGADLVVIDSLRRLMPSKSENDSDDMAPAVAAVAKLARDTGAAIVLVHHKGDGEKFYRGSSAIKDQADSLFGMLPVDPDDDDDLRRRITCRGVRGKAPRYDEAPPDRYVEVNFADGGVVAVDAPEDPGPVIPARQAVAEAIKAAMPAKTKTEAAEKVGRSLNDTSFRGAWEDLERAGEISKSGDGWELSSRRPTLDNGTTTKSGFGSTPSTGPEGGVA
jgi:archaellum biogenesis ATPase FlaH